MPKQKLNHDVKSNQIRRSGSKCFAYKIMFYVQIQTMVYLGAVDPVADNLYSTCRSDASLTSDVCNRVFKQSTPVRRLASPMHWMKKRMRNYVLGQENPQSGRWNVMRLEHSRGQTQIRQVIPYKRGAPLPILALTTRAYRIRCVPRPSTCTGYPAV